MQSGDEYILALWAPESPAMVALQTEQRSVPVVDLMGNERPVETREDVLFLKASEAVQFVRLPQPATEAVIPVELRTPQKFVAGETAELRLVLRNPLPQATDFAIDLSGLVERRVTAHVEAHATREEAVACTPPADLKPGPQTVNLQIRGAGRLWPQTAKAWVTSIRTGDFSAFFSTSFAEAAAPHVDVGGGPNLDDGQWHHLAATCALAAGQIAVYVDGRKVGGLGVSPELLKTVAEPLRFGAGTKGVLDEVRLYGPALSAAEVERLARKP